MLLSFFSEDKVEAGCDEAGRGCLAGPVVAAAVILPRDYKHPELNDSKQLTRKKREEIRKEIEREAICWGVSFVDNNEIDAVNILNASYLAMNRAIDQLKTIPELLLIDGNRYKPHNKIPFECIVKGDGKYYSIAAASILAKTFRDDYMAELAQHHPQYDWHTNVGYPTEKHREAIKAFGLTDYHRRSFRLLPEQLELFDEF
ncbi:Ribonuclease HII [Fulvivirga imtechensis AK7]|uniref:Ribonuclease HII n=1 Tax=Fulvivirga imtechensis AK7 TaxID=1237149 RepID=L8JV90_9BACT|nr:ribonuclease HII [Fulvivirga imtechensis]ELR72118.1 Ribonuclease HII [Fulvivirga imtechensis AK7]